MTSEAGKYLFRAANMSPSFTHNVSTFEYETSSTNIPHSSNVDKYVLMLIMPWDAVLCIVVVAFYL